MTPPGMRSIGFRAVMRDVERHDVWQASKPVRTQHEAQCVVDQWKDYQSPRFFYEVEELFAREEAYAVRTGWPPGMLQDDDKKLSKALSNKVDSRMHAREAAAAIASSCRKCGGTMKPGIATGQTFSTSDEGTCSPAGPGKIIECMKCSACGWSVSKEQTES